MLAVSSLRWMHILRVRTGSCSRPAGRQWSSPLLLERIAIGCLDSLLLNEATHAWIRLFVVRARIRVYRERTLARSIGSAVRIHASMHDRGRTRPRRWERLDARMRSSAPTQAASFISPDEVSLERGTFRRLYVQDFAAEAYLETQHLETITRDGYL